jgi:rhamnose utilization protein RhaD (predicted bifunctional aldolase and dehydrogenase)
MVAVSIAKIKTYLKNNNSSESDLQRTVDISVSPKGLRPSVEAPIHAVLDFKFVFHTHDININALAVQINSKHMFQKALSGLNWKFIPYVKPGIELSHQLIAIKSHKDNIFILENHGLVICGHNLTEIKKLIEDVRLRLKTQINKSSTTETKYLIESKINLKNSGYSLCKDKFINNLAFYKPWIVNLSKGVVLPDFLIFLGPNFVVLNQNDKNLFDKLKKLSNVSLPFNSCVILVDYGILIRDDALKGTLEITRSVYDLMCRIPDTANLKYLNEKQIGELINWEAEHYRQQLNKSSV